MTRIPLLRVRSTTDHRTRSDCGRPAYVISPRPVKVKVRRKRLRIVVKLPHHSVMWGKNADSRDLIAPRWSGYCSLTTVKFHRLHRQTLLSRSRLSWGQMTLSGAGLFVTGVVDCSRFVRFRTVLWRCFNSITSEKWINACTLKLFRSVVGLLNDGWVEHAYSCSPSFKSKTPSTHHMLTKQNHMTRVTFHRPFDSS